MIEAASRRERILKPVPLVTFSYRADEPKEVQPVEYTTVEEWVEVHSITTLGRA